MKEFLKFFLYITTGITIITAISYSFYDAESLPANTLWYIVGSGAVSSFVTVLFAPKSMENMKKFVTKTILHYLALCVVIASFGIKIGWFSASVLGVVTAFVDVGLVYAIVFVSFYITDVRQAQKINEKLAQRYSNPE